MTVQVGGMRVVQHKEHRAEKAATPPKPTEEEVRNQSNGDKGCSEHIALKCTGSYSGFQ